jgi:purine-binding chemotaxis protein CheW
MVVVFELSGERYGLAVEHVLEVVPVAMLTPVPGAGSHLLGLLNVRGRLTAALDLKAILDLPSKGVADLKHALVMAPNGAASFLVERAVQAIALPSALAPPPVVGGYLKGVAATENVTVLDGPALFADPLVDKALKA